MGNKYICISICLYIYNLKSRSMLRLWLCIIMANRGEEPDYLGLETERAILSGAGGGSLAQKALLSLCTLPPHSLANHRESRGKASTLPPVCVTFPGKVLRLYQQNLLFLSSPPLSFFLCGVYFFLIRRSEWKPVRDRGRETESKSSLSPFPFPSPPFITALLLSRVKWCWEKKPVLNSSRIKSPGGERNHNSSWEVLNQTNKTKHPRRKIVGEFDSVVWVGCYFIEERKRIEGRRVSFGFISGFLCIWGGGVGNRMFPDVIHRDLKNITFCLPSHNA